MPPTPPSCHARQDTNDDSNKAATTVVSPAPAPASGPLTPGDSNKAKATAAVVVVASPAPVSGPPATVAADARDPRPRSPPAVLPTPPAAEELPAVASASVPGAASSKAVSSAFVGRGEGKGGVAAVGPTAGVSSVKRVCAIIP